MRKKILISMIAFIFIIISLILYMNDMQMNECLELRVPKLTKRETIEWQNSDFFRDEELTKIYLTKIQAKSMLKEIEKNENWKDTEIDERLEEKLKFHTKDNIYYQIPEIENAYWIFTNRSHGVNDSHSVDDLIEDGMYYAISFGLFDVDNSILYYYEYDR